MLKTSVVSRGVQRKIRNYAQKKQYSIKSKTYMMDTYTEAYHIDIALTSTSFNSSEPLDLDDKSFLAYLESNPKVKEAFNQAVNKIAAKIDQDATDLLRKQSFLHK